jgi:hypothetical protein
MNIAKKNSSTVRLNGKRLSPTAFIAAAASVVVLMGVLLYALVPSVQNTAKLAALSTDDYYAQVMKKQVQENADALNEYLEMYSMNKDNAHNGTIAITAKEDFAKEYLELDKDYTFKANYLYNVKDDKMKFDTDIFVNSTKFLDLRTWSNLDTGSVYMTIPMLTSKTAYFPKEYFDKQFGVQNYYVNIDLTEKDVNSIAERYLDIYLKNAQGNTVLTKNSALSVSDVDGSYTKITVTLSGKKLANFYKDILTEIKNDKTVMAFCAKQYNISELEYTDKLAEQIKMLDEDVESGEYKDASLKIYTYVDASGNIVGVKAVLDDENHVGCYTADAYMIYNTKAEFACRISFTNDTSGEGISFIAKGKANGLSSSKAATGLTGTGILTISSKGYDYTTYEYGLQKTKVNFSFENLDLSEIQKGYLAGKIKVTTEVSTYKDFPINSVEFDENGMAKIYKDIVLTAEFAKDGKSQTMTADISYDNKPALTIDVSDKEVTPTEVTLPSKAYNMSDDKQSAAFYKSISLDKLEKAFKAEFGGLMTDKEIEQTFDYLEEAIKGS